jgi:hypothetical protein
VVDPYDRQSKYAVRCGAGYVVRVVSWRLESPDSIELVFV